MASPWAQAKAGKKISAPKTSKYHGYQGQAGGSSSISSQAKKASTDNLQRQKFFGGRNVPEERLRKRIKQDTLERQFKDRFTKAVNIINPITGEVTGTVSGLTQATANAPRSLAEERRRLANLYGPTPKEVFGDIGYGLGQLAEAYGIPFVSTAQRIGGGLKDLYDYFFTKPTVTTGGSSSITVTEEPLEELSSQLDSNNPLYNQKVYKPFRVSDMDITGMTAQNFGLPSLQESYKFMRNPQFDTPYGNVRLDNVLSGNPQLGYGNTIMINGVPVDLSATIGQGGVSGGLSFAFKNGGSVDKYAGLGYKLK